ncbi:hypothetical protein V7200_03675 [Cytobacillus firmus]|uniref:Uncharacterized protein n=1 Tax=Cytobacillus firmus TaxID=1399 RepID=A0A800MUC3_CYTFI|nr:hypothetical protein [Cytobacillus firmus]KAF0822663.1 hypothetical protein KIS1582_3557 [Cytobacillus firmus]
METKSHTLLNGWTLIGHKGYLVYPNKNAYVVLDPDNDTFDNEIEVSAANWSLNYKINIGFKTLKILNTPDEE